MGHKFFLGIGFKAWGLEFRVLSGEKARNKSIKRTRGEQS